MVWSLFWGWMGINFLMFLRFFFPRTLFEPRTKFSVGYPNDFGIGVDTPFQQDFRIWVVRNAERLFVIYARCTHLGCTPDWKESENKFKCPCHGSGYDSEGVNFEGPAPRPMDRAKVELDATGRIIVDTSVVYEKPKEGRDEFDDSGAFRMADENQPQAPKKGLGAVLGEAKEGARALKEKVQEEAAALKEPEKTQLFRSIFRVKHDDQPRNRSLSVLTNVFFHLHPAKINRDAVRYNYTWGMGGITFFLFLVLSFTGILLMFYYHPTKAQAFRDILYLEHDVPFGKLLRNMHRWGAHLMIITVWLHMFRVFLTGSYKRPREFNWFVGVLMLVLTLLLSFTGYLLPDDQLGFWAVTVGTNMARATPLLGHEGPLGAEMGMTPFNDVRFALLGGSIVDSNALLRSYIWHCIAIPLVAFIFMVVHFWRVRKDGGISGPAPVMLESEMKDPRKGPRPVIMTPSGTPPRP